MANRKIILIVDNVRSAHNVGSLLRTADAMAVERVYLVGISPHPKVPNDKRLPHVVTKAEQDIRKTALGAEKSLDIIYLENKQLKATMTGLRVGGYTIAALEQTDGATRLNKFTAPDNIGLIVGNEIDGLDRPTLELADIHLSIPMLGTKESLNVAVATGMALYHLRFAGQG